MYVLRKHGKTIRVFSADDAALPPDEPSHEEIAKTLMFYHRALLAQRQRADALSKQRDALAGQVALLERQLLEQSANARQEAGHNSHAGADPSGAEAASAPVASDKPRAGVQQATKRTSFKPPAPASGAKLGMLQALIDANKQLRKELQDD